MLILPKSKLLVPKKMFFTKGVGTHREELRSFELALRERYKHGNFEHDETHEVVGDLWDEWHELKADLPRGEE